MDQTLNVVLVQLPLVWERPEQNLHMFEGQFAAMPNETDVVILPEMFTTGFTMTPQNLSLEHGARTLAWMRQWAKTLEMALVGSCIYYDGGRYFNRLFFVYPNGDYQHYDKRHTFTLAGEQLSYTAGKSRLIVAFKGFKICPMICYDLRFPVWSRNHGEYDILLYVANWPGPRINAWDALLKARAIENMAYTIGVNRVGSDENGLDYPGHSAVYDPLGAQMTYTQEAGVVRQTLSMDDLRAIRDKLGFLKDADRFTLE